MNKKLKIILSGLGIVALVFIAGCNCYTKKHGSTQYVMEKVINKLEKKLALKPDQVKILENMKEKMLANKDERNEKRNKTYSLIINEIKEDDFNSYYTKKILKKGVDEKEKLLNLFIDDFDKFHKTLTKLQKEKLVEYIESIKDKHKSLH